MTVLDISKAYAPENLTGVAGVDGGSLAEDEYFYRVSCVNDEGELCACATESVDVVSPNNKVDLTWDAVNGVKASGGYKVYRNTVDSWDSGSLLIATVSTNSYEDLGGAGSSGTPVKFQADSDPTGTSVLLNAPYSERSVIAENVSPSREGVQLQYLGRSANIWLLDGLLQGTDALTELNKLRTFRSHGVPIYVTMTAWTVNIITDETFLIQSINFNPITGIDDTDASAKRFRYTAEMKRSDP